MKKKWIFTNISIFIFSVASIYFLHSYPSAKIICENDTNSPLAVILEGYDHETAEHLHWNIDFGTILPGKSTFRVVGYNGECSLNGLLNGKEVRTFSGYTIFVGRDTKYHIYSDKVTIESIE
jgi:hypothetical protein